MRAGLLSDSRIIGLLNREFVCTWVLVDDLQQHTGKDNPLADTLFDNWEYPLDLMFLTPGGEFAMKLNSFRDLPHADPDVGHPGRHRANGASNTDVFLRHARFFLSRL